MPHEDTIDAVIHRLSVDFRGTVQERMGIEYLDVRREQVRARMPVDGNTNSFRLLHGGASCLFAETLASVGAALQAGPDRMAMGLELNATHHRSVGQGHVHGLATAVHLGRTMATYDVAITDDQERRICTARVTCILLDRRSGGTATQLPLPDPEAPPAARPPH
jgi:uncharacterized protein (TIGR00369 family)